MTADFTSALFLGARHPADALPYWPRLTTGRPAALAELGSARQVARCIARQQGAADALLARSSLHALIDVVLSLASKGGAVVIDEHAYPISGWAATVGALSGVPTLRYRHHEPAHAAAVLERCGAGRSMVLTDGWCPGCLRPAPLIDLAGVAATHRAVLVVDDSLAAGILGARPTPDEPLGSGGMGTPGWLGIQTGRLVWVASGAKAWGAPVTAIAGPAEIVARIREAGPTRMHASAPSAADVAALRAAVLDPRSAARRHRLSRHITRVREHVRAGGLRPVGLPFPLLLVDDGADGAALHAGLSRLGVRTVRVYRRCAGRSSVGILLRADHREDEIDLLIEALARVSTSWNSDGPSTRPRPSTT